MSTLRSPSPAELLLQIMELASLGAVTEAQIKQQLRRTHSFARLGSRVGSGLATLAAEGLVEAGSGSGEELFRTTPIGLVTLHTKGRFPGAAAVLFTDIVRSTELIAMLGETEAHESRQRHFSQLRQAIEANGGREVKNLGDGLMVVFGEAAAAIACAIDMQRGIARDDDQLGLRVGIHSGELIRDGDDYFGSTVIVARRLCDIADAGQIVVSDAARESNAGAADDHSRSLGAVELKGLSVPVAASEIRWSVAPAGTVA